MLGGLCHYTSDLFLSVDEERVLGPLRWERQLPVHGGRGYGDLTPAPAGSFLRERVQQVAISFLTALRDGDRVQVSDLHHKFFTSDDSPEVMLTYLFDDPDSPFQSLRLAEPVAQMEIFAYREPLWRSGPEEPQSEQYAVACFCQTPDCRKAWPINSGDAFNTPTRPYACVFVTLTAPFGEQDAYIETLRTKSGLLEPAITR